MSEAFGRAVRRLRETQGLYQRELAASSGVCLTTVKHCEQGYGVTLETAVMLADALGWGLDVMLEEGGASGGRVQPGLD